MGMPLQRKSLAEYLAWEAEQADRNEFYRGEIFLMVGGTRAHGRIVANMSRRLGNHLDGSACQVFQDGTKVQIADDTVLYPDVFVTCGKTFRDDDQVITDPLLVIEVLSPSTQGYDRSAKFAFYRRLPSLREYVLIDPDTRRVEVFRPEPDGNWKLFDMTEAGALTLASITLDCPMAWVFEGMADAGATKQ
ncbi:Uma2 family endonuclease [Variovorax rhizosphaerae]|uniref:Uma2 family endonuclease n=1 Tax=Variovorax rhizosphaerae TaxID=1836200 RepID=A0ABU8WYY6_9BURK